MPTNRRRLLLCCTPLAAVLVTGCPDEANAPVDPGPVVAGAALAPQPAVVGSPFSLDLAGAFTDRRNKGLTYTAEFTTASNALALSNGKVVGSPLVPGVVIATVVATDAQGDTASQRVQIAVFTAGLTSPTLPPTPFAYSDGARPIPQWYLGPNAPGGSAIATSNMPATNSTSDAGATLGRVLFYDKRLSANDQVACASCHLRAFGFGDSAQFSTGFAGGKTGRHSMALANARFYARGRAFWDERAVSLEDQALRPIQDAVEMGLSLDNMIVKLRATPYYAPLFQAAFGTSAIDADRVGRALAQYVRSIISYGSRFDSVFINSPPPPAGPNFGFLTTQEQEGLNLFNGGNARCAQCHATNAHISDNLHNTGLDSIITDVGAGGGRFKSPSLRNVAVRARFMHDGRFTTLEQVVDFYNTGVKANAGLDGRLREAPGGPPRRLGLTVAQRDAIVAYLKTLTDNALMTDQRFANPFP